jgi:hypothetical protein
MAENLMVGSHKGTNKQFREGYDRTFRRRQRELTLYCKVDEHDDFYEAGIKICPRCGDLTDPRIDRDPTDR